MGMNSIKTVGINDRVDANDTSPAPGQNRPSWFRRVPLTGLVGLLVALFWVVVSVLGPWITPYDPAAMVSDEMLGSMSAAHPFGTDFLGRDMLSRLLDGTRYTMGLALSAALLSCVVGGLLGLLTSLCGRWIEEPVSRIVDAIISIPSKMLALVMVSVFGANSLLLIATAVLAYFPGAYRIARSLAMNISQLEYVQAARSRGEGRIYIALVEMLPNMMMPMLTDLGMRFVFIVLLLSGMSFLGLGVQPPAADLGSLVKENISGLSQGAPAVLIPALAIGTITISVNLLIDAFGAKRR